MTIAPWEKGKPARGCIHNKQICQHTKDITPIKKETKELKEHIYKRSINR